MYNNYQNYLKQKQIGENIYFENNNYAYFNAAEMRILASR